MDCEITYPRVFVFSRLRPVASLCTIIIARGNSYLREGRQYFGSSESSQILYECLNRRHPFQRSFLSSRRITRVVYISRNLYSQF